MLYSFLCRITDVINKVFGVSLLLNFMSSSVLVCFLGFLLSIGVTPILICKLGLYLVAATVEIYLLCYFSESLIDAVSDSVQIRDTAYLHFIRILQSEGVSSAVYEMNWFGADEGFKKMLIVIAIRAQKPVFLKATVFLDMSMSTMTMVS